MKFFNSGCLAPELNVGIRSFAWKPIKDVKPSPLQRSQHAICVCGRSLYMYGGRGLHGTRSDLWQFNFDTEVWTGIDPSGDKPPPLEGHTLVEYGGSLYMFGGEMSFASAGEVPLWVFSPKLCTWTKETLADTAPTGRREHTAVVYKDQMCVYGGYIDLKGPTDEMWMYCFDEGEWNLIEESTIGNSPLARYKHAAVVHGDTLWICGGLMRITDRNETQVWTWDFSLFTWCQVRTKGAPLQLFNHATCIVDDEILVFGGNHEDGKSCSNLWRMCITDGNATQVWQLCRSNDKVVPSPSSNHCLISVPSKLSRPSNAHLQKEDLKPVSVKDSFNVITNHAVTDSLPEIIPTECNALPSQRSNVIEVLPYIPSAEKISPTSDNQADYFAVGDEKSSHAPADVTKDHNSFDKLQNENSRTNDYFMADNGKESLLTQRRINSALRLRRTRQWDVGQNNLLGFRNDAFISSPSPTAVHEKEAVKRFSYNLSNSGKTWRLQDRKSSKFETTSFIELKPLNVSHGGNTILTAVNSPPKSVDAVQFTKVDNEAKVTLPVSFIENAKLLNQVEENLVNKEQVTVKNKTQGTQFEHNSRDYCLLLVGGKQAETSLHMKHPISMWKCNIKCI